jgi:hypothetical protein
MPDRRDPWTTPQFEQSVRDTAYFMWENDGRPDGQEQEYWSARLKCACADASSIGRAKSWSLITPTLLTTMQKKRSTSAARWG